MKLRSLFRRTWDGWSDRDLVDAFQQKGKELYFDALFERYHPLVYNLCLNFTANREESKDLTLDVFLKAYQYIKSQQVEQFDHWICILTKNTCLTYLKNQRREAEKQKKWWEFEESGQNFMENTAFRRLIYEEELENDHVFKEGLNRLSGKQQLCINLFFMQGYSYRKIAQENDLTEKQVKSHIQNGKRQLKNWVSGQKNKVQKL